MIYRLLRPLLFGLNPESSRKAILLLLSLSVRGKTTNKPAPLTLMGIEFANPIGMAAGLDVDGRYIDTLFALGFGFIEIGTITPQPQLPGPGAYLRFLPHCESILHTNAKFINSGVEQLWLHLSKLEKSGVLGINISSNDSTTNDKVALDYKYCIQRLYKVADYFVINLDNIYRHANSKNMLINNLSNTYLGDQAIERKYNNLLNILSAIKQVQLKQADKHGSYVPIVIKISPELNANIAELKLLLDALVEHSMDGIILVGREFTQSQFSPLGERSGQHGSLDLKVGGRALKQAAGTLLRTVADHLQGKLPIISGGGIFSSADVNQRLQHGAQLVQLYSALLYRGPGVVGRMLAGL